MCTEISKNHCDVMLRASELELGDLVLNPDSAMEANWVTMG